MGKTKIRQVARSKIAQSGEDWAQVCRPSSTCQDGRPHIRISKEHKRAWHDPNKARPLQGEADTAREKGSGRRRPDCRAGSAIAGANGSRLSRQPTSSRSTASCAASTSSLTAMARSVRPTACATPTSACASWEAADVYDCQELLHQRGDDREILRRRHQRTRSPPPPSTWFGPSRTRRQTGQRARLASWPRLAGPALPPAPSERDAYRIENGGFTGIILAN